MPIFSRVTAFSLVEVTLALGICAFCLLAIFGLLPVGIKSGRMAVGETAAAGLLSMAATDLREAPAQGGQTTFFSIPVSADSTDSGTPVIRFLNDSAQWSEALQADSSYRLTVRFLSSAVPGSSSAKMATMADVGVSWPAQADPAMAEGSLRLFVAVDRN